MRFILAAAMVALVGCANEAEPEAEPVEVVHQAPVTPAQTPVDDHFTPPPCITHFTCVCENFRPIGGPLPPYCVDDYDYENNFCAALYHCDPG